MIEDAAVLVLGEEEEIEDPSMLIVDAVGTYENCTFIPLVKRTHDTDTDTESDSSIESSSSAESEFMPIGPPRRSFYFEFESTIVFPPTEALIDEMENAFAYLPDFEINSEWISGRFEELMLFDERRLRALYHIQGYQRRIARAFNKKVKSRDLQEGDMVLKEICAPIFDLGGKFRPKWVGPYIIKSILSGGAASIVDLDGNKFSNLVNLDQLK
ncbi:hypothetical protein RHMOL_Rhmol01G0145700 [Rhododendron molle]|uniref:Uncharacterized protein n=1 Tax=Rhododendron molle TaxID=49168 RepID=A0ACC0Q1T5_RHOML|nr:hypothetical protein RHMOL_Rhmol01G0145700 [Rhododendron molle]